VSRALPIGLAAALVLVLAGCNPSVPEPKAKQQQRGEPEPETVDIPQTVTAMAPGTTPMRERVAVLGVLNKRNGISRDIELKPGQAIRVGDDVVVRLRACETTAPWEVQRLTGAFVQLDVRNTQDQFQRVFSGWLYKETPSLNVVEHPVYDVWPKSCKMTHPDAAESDEREGAAASNRSRAPNSAVSPAPAPEATPTPEAAPEPPEESEPSTAASNVT
jgi:hypothetical protein